MNERIKKFAEQAGFGKRDNELYTSRLEHLPITEDIEKFAELIVRECCEVAHCNFHVDGLTLGGILREHFGVEE